MEGKFKTYIDEAQSILLVIPTKPYFDQVAAALSLFLSLSADKSVSIISPTPTTVEFNRLVGVNKISQDIGNKNLVIKFTDYKAEDIERVSYDIENREFRLTVIPKTGITAPHKDQINLSYAGLASDLVILVGGANEAHFPILSDNGLSGKGLAGAKIIHVGNRELSAEAGKGIISFAGNASTVSEIAAYLINEAGLKINADVATNLLMGIELGTENFTAPQVDANTFQLIASLMQLGGKRLGQQQPLKAQDFPAGSIPTSTPLATDTSTTGQQNQVQVQQVDQNNPTDENKSDEEIEQNNPPKDWLEPKIYKGNSTN
jgi:hypothetical protein